MAKKKNPWISAVLNFLFWGAGYLYNGKRMGLGIGLFIGGLINIAGSVVSWYQPVDLTFNDIPIMLIFLSEIVISITLAYDAYKEAKRK